MRNEIQRRDGGIDWPAIRARLSKAEAATQEALNPSPARAKEIMDARARKLARKEALKQAPGAKVDVVLFGLGKERYAIETQFVREVIRLSDFTPVPGTPDFVVGVTNLRGLVVAVMDLRRFFNVARQGLTDLSRVLVLGTERIEFGLLADETHGQTEFQAADILPARGQVSGIGGAYLRGVTTEATAVLNGAMLLNDTKLYVNQI